MVPPGVNDGEYTIDNSVAERCIRPYAAERKNSLFYGSHRMARVSAVYHTLIATCRMMGANALDYLKAMFLEIAKGRRDFQNLTPAALCCVKQS
ncbi:MAG: transposase [Bacteroidales bacterium]|nr:transposase [Bacteroidales bacterium]